MLLVLHVALYRSFTSAFVGLVVGWLLVAPILCVSVPCAHPCLQVWLRRHGGAHVLADVVAYLRAVNVEWGNKV